MIRISGNIFDSDCQALVNPVNIVGVMGAGLALQFKKRFPGMFLDYNKACRDDILHIGKIHAWQDKSGKWILNFPTKINYFEPSEIEYIKQGLIGLAETIHLYDIKSIAIPQLGCGLGGLDFKDVLPLIEEFAKTLPDVTIEVYG